MSVASHAFSGSGKDKILHPKEPLLGKLHRTVVAQPIEYKLNLSPLKIRQRPS